MSDYLKISKYFCLGLLLSFSGNSMSASGFFDYDYSNNIDLSIDLTTNNINANQSFTVQKGFSKNLAKFVNRTFDLKYRLGISNASITELSYNPKIGPKDQIAFIEATGKLTLQENKSPDEIFRSEPYIFRALGDGSIVKDATLVEGGSTISSNKTSLPSTFRVDLDVTKKINPDISGTGIVFAKGSLITTDSYKLWSITPKTQQTLQNTAETINLAGSVIGRIGSVVSFSGGATSGKFDRLTELGLFNDLISGTLGIKSFVTNDPILSNENATAITQEVLSTAASALLRPVDPLSYVGAALGSLSLFSHSTAVGLAYLASDPPDLNYKTLTALNYVAISSRPNAGKTELAFTTLSNDLLNFSDTMRVATSSLEKYQGAIAAKDFDFAQSQLDYFNQNESKFLSLLATLPTDITDFKNSLNEFNILGTTQDLKFIIDLHEKAKSNPLYLSELETFLALYYPGAKFDKDLLLTLDGNTLLLALSNTPYASKNLGQQLDLLADTYAKLGENYEVVVQNPSSVPLPASSYFMAGGLLGLSLFRKLKSNPVAINYA